jgi:uncharacterized protein YxjI
MTSAPPPPGWYPDQLDPRLVRWWDGRAWTAASRPAQPGPPVSEGAAIELDIEDPGPHPQAGRQCHPWPRRERARRRRDAVHRTDPGGQPARQADRGVNEYGVFDQHGNRFGGVVEVGQGAVRKAVRLLTKYDQFLTHRFEIRDARHDTVLKVVRPAKLVKSRFLVTRGDDSPVGEIVQENVFGKIRFGFGVDGRPAGGIRAKNWRAWNFSIVDEHGREVAKVTKTWGAFVRAAFTTADDYVVEIHRPLADPAGEHGGRVRADHRHRAETGLPLTATLEVRPGDGSVRRRLATA